MRKYGELIFALIMLFVTAVYLILILQIPMNGGFFNGRFFPVIIDICLFVLTIFQFWGYWKTRGAQEGGKGEAGETAEAKDGKTVFYTAVLIVFYIAFMAYLGFVLSTFLYLVLQFTVMTPREKKINFVQYIVIAAVSSLAIYFVFRYTELAVMLPQGILTMI